MSLLIWLIRFCPVFLSDFLNLPGQAMFLKSFHDKGYKVRYFFCFVFRKLIDSFNGSVNTSLSSHDFELYNKLVFSFKVCKVLWHCIQRFKACRSGGFLSPEANRRTAFYSCTKLSKMLYSYLHISKAALQELNFINIS